MPLSLRQLRYFAQIAKSGVMAHAAEDLGVAQSALSHHVAELEVLLGVKLFDRKPRGVALTAAGERLYQHAAAIIASLDKAEADVRGFTETASGPIRLGLCHTAIGLLSFPIMQRCISDLPGVFLNMTEGGSGQLIARLERGELDMVVGYNPPDDSRFSTLPLLEEQMYLIGTRDIIGAEDGPIAFARIPRGKVIGLNTVRASRAIINSHLLRRQIEPSPHLELDSLTAIVKAMRAGFGCSILARATVRDELASGNLHARQIVDPVLKRGLFLISPADTAKTQAENAIRDLVIQSVRTALSDGSWPGRSLMP
ncbi:LysR family transcriptional regulator [Paracoccus sp. M683]|uniref:LysR family transcriptional regulator n=1 Tax=Paracoccus sp. M683 TaxID=2594268 RepID=UPI001180AF47|nr:LysR family transcriptional regulator [Paracoccus sp. M683]TRW95363.1 LysR family transcriptional regulator [Paracoccus sp. M683]